MATLSRPASRSGRFTKPVAVLSSFINNGRFIKAKDQASGRNGRFIKQKRPNCRISQLRAADCRFHIAPYKEFISGQAEPFLSRVGKAICRFIKAGQPQRAFYQRRWPFYQGRPASIAILATVAALSRPGQWPQWPVYHQEAAAWPDL